LLFFSDPEVNIKVAGTLPRTIYLDVIKVAIFLGYGGIYHIWMTFCVEESYETLRRVEFPNETVVPYVVKVFVFFPARASKVHGSYMYSFWNWKVIIIHLDNKCLYRSFQFRFDQMLSTFVSSQLLFSLDWVRS
jgi:hypothetical protein